MFRYAVVNLRKKLCVTHIRIVRKERSMNSKRFVVNALTSVALLAIFAYSSWYVNQPRFGYALYAVTSGDKAYYTLSAIDAIFFYVAGPLSIALIAFIVIYNIKKR